MKWFLNLKTAGKLIVGFGVMILFLGVVTVIAYRTVTQVQESQRQLYEEEFAYAVDIKDLRMNQSATRANVAMMILETKRASQDLLVVEIKTRNDRNSTILQRLLERSKSNPWRLSKLEELKSIREASHGTRESQTFPLIYAGKTAEATKVFLGIQSERDDKMDAIADELVEEADKAAQAAITQSVDAANQATRVFIILSVLSILLAVVMTSVASRVIANPLRTMSTMAERIAAGDLAITQVSDNRADEVGSLAQSFQRMTQALQEMAAVAREISMGNLSIKVRPQSDKDVLGNAFALMVENLQSKAGIARQISKGDLTVSVELQSEKDVLGQAFTTMVENLRRMTQEIREGINILGSSASEILAATTQVASGASETATAVSETTTTVEEVKQTAQVASQKSKYVSESAQKAANVSQGGRRAVEDMVEGMTRIREQMESIAESITRLSEQSQAIGEIIAAVNDLAEQSNLLAVNAAIEAAKAGEQGKGFAVVAQEVKSLAEQSKQATTQVRGILNDIQKGTSAAVMATEQGSKAVEAGVKQSTEAGESIKLLADSIVEAAQAATQIAASSQQQLVGMDQVASAMENIKQASTQNVASTRQAEEAAKNLHELGQKLQKMSEQYKLNHQ